MARLSNPIALTKGPVTFFTTLVYAGIIVALIVVHTTLPTVPTKLPLGINITEAWLDLQHLTSSHHPYNARSNDLVRDWILIRIESIFSEQETADPSNKTEPHVHIFSDLSSNLTFSSPGSVVGAGTSGLSVYFEGTNIIVYIRGSEDGDDNWWKDPKGKPKNDGGVLVNAHYDSVSTGFGATDDGVGVVSILQLIRYYTTPGNAPKKGLVALFNNGEEDFLNGARAFSQHPLSKFPHTFLNLEGAGAGGKAFLFRSTDTEVTRAYKSSPYPFGSVITGDGFKRGLVRSQTDYVVFDGILGIRGLDVAFFEPRSRYHTGEDDARHTSKESLWHMLSAALATTKELTSDTSSTFVGEPSTKGGVDAGTGSAGVWFDLFGQTFAVFQLHTLFALSITLLVVAPVFLLLTIITVHRVDRFYLFSKSKLQHTPDGDELIPLYGWRGFFRFPLIFVVSCAAPTALGYAIYLINPQIAHSSEWSVWSMMFSSFIFVAWILCRTADYIRPSGLTRSYGFLWMFLAWWAVLVANTVFETQLKMAGGYFVLFFFAGIAFATWISLLELFALPKKAEIQEPDASWRPSVGRNDRTENAATEQEYVEGEEADERTGLLANRRTQTFARYSEEQGGGNDAVAVDKGGPHHNEEQSWSKSLPTWTWLLQFVLVAPIVIIVVGQIGLVIVGALHQTGQDGSSMLILYMFMAIFTILILSPLVPFLHRFTWHVPTFMLLVLIGTLIYNLTAFPFSSNNRLKLFFQQQVDLDSGINTITLEGLSPYVEYAARSLPDGEERFTNCVATSPSGRGVCKGHGLPPQVVDSDSNLPPETQYRNWLTYNISRSADANTARFMVSGRNTRACKILFDSPISNLHVHGAGPNDKRFPPVPEAGSKEIRLWSRTWNRTWTVDVEWEGQGANEGLKTGMEGKVVCMWSDANQEGIIPALDEARKFLPVWAAVTKLGDGLVEGGKRFII
jgi:hypothetical protein